MASDSGVVESCGQASASGPLDATVTAIPTKRGARRHQRRHLARTRPGEDPVAMQIWLPPRPVVGCGMWTSFVPSTSPSCATCTPDAFGYFLALRLAVLSVVAPVLVRMHRRRRPPSGGSALCDVLAYSVVRRRDRAHVRRVPRVHEPRTCPGSALSLLAHRDVARPVEARPRDDRASRCRCSSLVLLGSAAFSPHVAAQLHDPASITTLLLGAAYVLAPTSFSSSAATSCGRCAGRCSRRAASGAIA